VGEMRGKNVILPILGNILRDNVQRITGDEYETEHEKQLYEYAYPLITDRHISGRL
jgi:hypothetical protein